jgi:glycosyltransferase involved in cell wall biosynthesis
VTRPVPILLIALQLDVGGNERDLAKLARYLDPARFQVHVASFRPGGERVAELEAAGIPILHIPVRSLRNLSVLAGARILRAYVREHGIRLIHAYDPPTSIFAVPLARMLGLPAVSSHCYFRLLVPPPHSWGLRLVDRLANRIVVNAEAVKQHLIRDYSIPAERIYVSYNGVETGVFFPRSETRPEFLTDASLVFGSICVMREEKRLDTLLTAFARVLPRDPRLRLLLVGDGPMREPWIKLRDKLGLTSACHFEQTTTNIPYWMNAMDVFVLASRSEGFPNALLEAMACGCCVVASAVGGVPELVEDSRSGFLFPSGDADALAARLLAIVEDPALRLRVGAEAALRARERFSMESAATSMEQLYGSLLTTQ